MNNQITIFNHEMFGEIRISDQGGESWFIAKDILNILGLTHITNALKGLDEDELTVIKLQSGGQLRNIKLVNESGMYSLVLRSNKPEAKVFKKWITSEVLPAIRKTGAYHFSVRLESKAMRRDCTDAIKQLVDYAFENGSQSAERYYVSLTKMIYDRLGILPFKEKVPDDFRDKLSKSDLQRISMAEMLLGMKIAMWIKEKIHYKAIYQNCKSTIQQLSTLQLEAA